MTETQEFKDFLTSMFKDFILNRAKDYMANHSDAYRLDNERSEYRTDEELKNIDSAIQQKTEETISKPLVVLLNIR